MQQEPSITAPTNTDNQPHVGGSRREGWRSIFSTLAILVAAPVVALILTAFVFQSYQVDGPSMETTLHNNDRLIVWKMPKTISKITGHAYIPHRGDIIIFVAHGLEDAGGTQDKQLIKRVIGLPGDRVVVKDGAITIYNDKHPEGFNPDINHDFSSGIASFTSGDIDMVVPKDQVFVCGDNRPNSLDSRFNQIGTVRAKDIVGKLTLRIFPLNSAKSFI